MKRITRMASPLLALSVAGCWLGLGPGVGTVGEATTELSFQLVAPTETTIGQADAERVGDILSRRLKAAGLADLPIVDVASDSLTVQRVPADQADLVRELATTPGFVAFVGVPPAFADQVEDGKPLPAGMTQVPIFGNEGIAGATSGNDAATGQRSLELELTDEAGALFDTYAGAHLGERFAIVLDGAVVVAPTIRATRFGGRAQITGDFDEDSVRRMVGVLSAGPLPFELVEVADCRATDACGGPSPEVIEIGG